VRRITNVTTIDDAAPLDPVLAESVRGLTTREAMEAGTLPPEAYWSPELYEREIKHIFLKEWLCVGRVEDVPEAGDFFTYQIATEPLIIVRDHEGQIRAHLNVCRHRACPVVEGSGNAPAFKCPYHGWMYGLSGELRGAPEFRNTKNFDKQEYPLRSAQVEVWEGFIMVNLDPNAEAFAPRMSETTEFGLDKYHLEDQVTIRQWEFRLNSNWKAWMENAIEEYHIPWVHPGTFQVLSPMKGWIDFPEISEQPWAVMVGQFPGLSLSATGEPKFPIYEDTQDLPPAFNGIPIWISYPSLGMFNTVDSSIYFTVHPDGPENSMLRLALLIPSKSAEAYKAGVPEVVAIAEEYMAGVDVFIDEDNTITERQHVGLRAHSGAAGRFSKHEVLAYKFDKWVAERAYLND
jgi:choline monooxygenase